VLTNAMLTLSIVQHKQAWLLVWAERSGPNCEWANRWLRE
jgi:hypothetical protein